ncbi:MAG TPA: SLC13 family permease [Candidatus Limnocylindria bacterium]|nr:SLC13 family permease [Candidatus Limnocylindria bacterium]
MGALDRDPVADLLRGVPFFAGLDRIDLARLLGALEEVRETTGDVISAEGSEADALYLVQQGRLAISVRAPDGEIVLREVAAPGHFGELGLLLARRTATSRALTDVVLWRLPRTRFEALVRDRPQIGLAVAAALADAVDRRSREYAGAPAPERVTEDRPQSTRPGARRTTRTLGAVGAVALPLLLWNASPPSGLEPVGWRVVLLLLGAAIAWLAEPVPDFAVALGLATAWGATGLVSLPVAFSGFASSSWLLALGALALAAAMARTGLLFRTALVLLRVFPATATGQLFALLFGGVLVTPLVPLSVARVAAIMPVASEIGQSLGYAPRSNGSARLAFAGLVGYWYFSSIFLTGLATNFFVVQLLAPAERARFSWLGWLGAAAPVGILCLVGAAAALLVLFRPERAATRIPDATRRQQQILGPLSRGERSAILAAGLLLAGLIAQPLLKVEPAWLAILALVVVTAGALDRERFRSGIDWGFLMLFGALLGSGNVMQATHVDTWVAAGLVERTAALGDPGLVLIAIAAATILIRFVLPSRPTMLLLALAVVPAAPQLGISPWLAGLGVLLAANIWILPYQGLEYLIAREATGGEAFDDRQGTRLGAALTAVRFIAIAASVPAWKLMGLLG